MLSMHQHAVKLADATFERQCEAIRNVRGSRYAQMMRGEPESDINLLYRYAVATDSDGMVGGDYWKPKTGEVTMAPWEHWILHMHYDAFCNQLQSRIDSEGWPAGAAEGD